MSHRILAALIVTISSLSAVGCANSNMQGRVDELTLENEDLARQKAAVESDLLACRARCEALERGRKGTVSVTPTPYDAPAGLNVRRRGNETVIELPCDVFFSSGSSDLNGAGQKAMGQVVDFLKKNSGGGLIRVEGHSDSDPIRKTKSKYHCNWELSFERSHAVMHHLVEKGKLDPHQVVCEAYGEFHPQETGNKAKNRRVEIVIARGG